MDISSVRALKQEIREKVVSPLMVNEIQRRGLGMRARRVSDLARPRTLALGIAKQAAEYKLAVRIQNPMLQGSKHIETIREMARQEVDIRFIGHVHPFQVPLQQQRLRPLTIGCSVGHFRVTAGTLGAFVRAQSDGQTMILSNNHVLADENRGQIGDDIIQPGSFDSGQDPDDRIGTLANFIRLDFTEVRNAVDCAIARLDDGVSLNTGLEEIGRFAGVNQNLEPQEPVRKIGRTTGLTQGMITAIELDGVRVGYDQGEAVFDGQVEIEGVGAGPFSQGGDSGSLIIDQGGQAVALLFAGGDNGGSNGMGLTYANHLSLALRLLAVDLLT